MSGREPPAQAVDGSALCLECGLCCDGTVFRHTELGADEAATARALGVTLITIGEAGPNSYPAIPQGCPLFRDGGCSSYGRWRPKACGDYACRLLTGYVAGTRTLADCRDVVRAVRAAVEESKSSGSSDAERLRAAGLLEVFRRKFFKTESDPGPLNP